MANVNIETVQCKIFLSLRTNSNFTESVGVKCEHRLWTRADIIACDFDTLHCDERNELNCLISTTTLLLQEQQFRQMVSPVDIELIGSLACRHLSAVYSSAVTATYDSIETVNARIDFVTNVSRLLRNACADCKSSQLAIARCADLPGVLSRVIRVFACDDKIQASMEHYLTNSEKVTLMLRVTVQLAGNAVSKCSQNSCIFWQNLFPTFSLLLSSKDTNLRKYTCMLIYNCLNVPEHISELFETFSGLAVISLVLEHVTHNDCEWSLFIAEMFVAHRNAVCSCWSIVSDSSREFLAEVICTSLHRSDDSAQDLVDIENLLFLAELVQQFSDNSLPNWINTILECLCLATAKPLKYTRIRDNEQLLRSAVDMLRRLHLYDHQNDAVVVSASDERVVGVKCRLVQLIGNIVYRSQRNQDLVRQIDGIPLILSQTKLDEKGPMLPQFAVMAARNLCEGNEENQKMIASMKLEALTDNVESLARLGIRAEIVDDKIVVCPLDK